MKPYTFAFMYQANWLRQSLNISLCLLAFSIPLPFILSSISIILVLVLWLPQADFRQVLHRLRHNRMLLAWMLFYLLHAVSYFYSEHKAESLFDLQTKLSFLILPFVIGAGVDINRKRLENIFLGFVAGVTVAALFCLIQATADYRLTGDKSLFFYHSLIRGMNANAVYMAWYVIISISVLLLFDWDHFFRRRGGQVLRWTILMLQFVFFVLLSSKMLLVLLFFCWVPVYYVKQLREYRLWQRLVILAFIAGAVGGVFFSENPIRNRYEDVMQNNPKDVLVRQDRDTNVRSKLNNLTLRLFLWKSGIGKIAEDRLWLTGVGNGDVHPDLNHEMYEAGITNMYHENNRSDLFNVNLHNMYVQSLFMLGIPGLTVFLVMMLAPFFALRYIREKTIFFIFQVTAVLFMMQESALQTHAGIVFFTFFSQVFWNRSYYNREKILRSPQ